MPFTLFHLGPSLLAGLLLLGVFDLPALLVSSVVVDVEPFCVLFFSLDYPLHGFMHSFLGGSAAAVLASVVLYVLRNPSKQLTAVFRLKQDSSFGKILWSSFFGVYSHILLDSPLYADIKPFYPSEANPLLSVFTPQQVYLFCGLSFLAGMLFYLGGVDRADGKN